MDLRILFLIFIFIIASCTDIAMTGAQFVYNRHSIQNNLTDHYVTREVYQSLYQRSDEFKDSHIVIATYNGDVLLTGQVPQVWQRHKADEIVKKIPYIKTVYNLIAIASPTSSITRLSDAWITGKVKAGLITASDVDASKIKVVTENGTVYLMSTLTAEEGADAARIASNIDGVRGVVKVFNYIKMVKA